MKAKTKLTKLWSILIALVMLVGLLPTTALAAEATATADFTSGDGSAALELLNAAKTEGVADSEWDSTTNTLTLNGVNFETAATAAVKLPNVEGGVTIVLNGVNTIKGGDSASEDCYGIYAEGNLTISGSGTLNVTGGNMTGTAAGSRSCGIYTDQVLTISGGTVKAYGGATYKASLGIYSKKNINISDTADVTAIGGTATDDGSFGINAEGEVIISGGEVKATGGKGKGSDGIYSGRSKVTINGGTVMAIGGVTTGGGWSVGIYAYGGEVTINGGTVTSAADYNSSECYTFTGSVTGNDIKTISFNSNGGSGKWMVAKISGETYTLPENVFTAPDDKVFKGWKVGSEIKAVGGEIDADDSTTVYAQWGDVEYAVTVTNGTASPSKAAAGTTVTLNANTAPSGQVFDKWVVESGSITLADATSATTTFTMPDRAVALIATYEDITVATTYTVTFNANGGSSTMADVPGVSGDYTLPANGFAAPAGMQFKGWATSADGAVISGTTINVTADTTLYAIWEAIPFTTYTVTFNANGGSVTPASAVTDTDGKLTSLPTPTRSRYSFNGWYTEASGGTKVDTNYVFNANTTIYAHWTYTGGGGGGSTVTTNTVTADSVKNGDVAISPKYAAKGTIVTLKIEPDKGYKLDTVTVTDKNGNKIELTDKGNGEYTFKMPATKVNVETTFVEETTTEDNTMMNLFVDIPDDTYYYDAVLWAAKNGITGGMDDTHFAPDITCTRVQAITFLWRAAGSPMPKGSEISFEDVETDSYYYYAVLWALENGITSGTSATTFSPDDTCSRGQIVTFLWRSEKSPTVGMDNTFTDVSSDSYYADATNWAVANGITSGTSDTTFSPDETCTRGQIVTFLYRFFVK